jgi:ATP-dependent DNA helicase RecQ
MDFCHKFSFHSLSAFHALKHLERAGYIELTEDIDLPARVHFRVDRDELYKFQVANDHFDPIIRLMLRVYSGMFSDFVKIDEYNLAAKAKATPETVMNALSVLQNMGIIYYLKPKRTSQIIYTAERLEDKSLLFGRKEYEDQEAQVRMRMDTMVHYVNEDYRCRSQMLLMYFGEKDPFPCRQCDVCQRPGSGKLNQYEREKIHQSVHDILLAGPVTLPDLNSRIAEDPQKISMVLDELFESRTIAWNEGLIVWIEDNR